MEKYFVQFVKEINCSFKIDHSSKKIDDDIYYKVNIDIVGVNIKLYTTSGYCLSSDDSYIRAYYFSCKRLGVEKKNKNINAIIDRLFSDYNTNLDNPSDFFNIDYTNNKEIIIIQENLKKWINIKYKNVILILNLSDTPINRLYMSSVFIHTSITKKIEGTLLENELFRWINESNVDKYNSLQPKDALSIYGLSIVRCLRLKHLLKDNKMKISGNDCNNIIKDSEKKEKYSNTFLDLELSDNIVVYNINKIETTNIYETTMAALIAAYHILNENDSNLFIYKLNMFK